MHGADRRPRRRAGAADGDHAVALQHGGEEPVRPVPARRQREVAARSRAAAPASARPRRAARGAKAGMRCRKRVHLRLVLRRQQRAGGVDQPAARPHQPRGRVEDARLLGHQFGEVALGAAAAARRGCAATCRCRCRARRPARGRTPPARRLAHLSPALDQMPLDVVHAGPAQPPHRALEPRRRHVAGDDVAAIAHHHRHRQRLAARAGAPIHHPHLRPGADQGGDQLAALVLDLDQARTGTPARS